jgi:hypothetical protein
LSISYQAAASVLTKNITSYTELKNLPIGAYATDGQVRIVKETNQLESSNVIGVLEGTDKRGVCCINCTLRSFGKKR